MFSSFKLKFKICINDIVSLKNSCLQCILTLFRIYSSDFNFALNYDVCDNEYTYLRRLNDKYITSNILYPVMLQICLSIIIMIKHCFRIFLFHFICVYVILVHINHLDNLESYKSYIITGKICKSWRGFQKSSSIPLPLFFHCMAVLWFVPSLFQIPQCTDTGV
jgi:hypothetical protein